MTPREILEDMGWSDNRRFDVTIIKKHLIEKGYSWFPKVEAFFFEFGELKSEKLHFDAIHAEMGVDSSWILKDYASRCPNCCSPDREATE